MKTLAAFILGLSLSITSYASESLEVTIKLEEDGYGQAAVYVNAELNDSFVQKLLTDKDSRLNQLKSELEMEACGENSTATKTWIDGCGEVEVTSAVQTAFGRGGWADAGAAYTFFIGFRNAGTGRFFEATHMITISESVEAVMKEDGEFAGKFLKTLKLETIKKL